MQTEQNTWCLVLDLDKIYVLCIILSINMRFLMWKAHAPDGVWISLANWKGLSPCRVIEFFALSVSHPICFLTLISPRNFPQIALESKGQKAPKKSPENTRNNRQCPGPSPASNVSGRRPIQWWTKQRSIPPSCCRACESKEETGESRAREEIRGAKEQRKGRRNRPERAEWERKWEGATGG